ncbi:carboxymuconolactone decarboxylase family protein [Flavobacterium sp. Sd200]|uniref:carboxymuconolactone decarboxylase family protein n=1 Tax=Flavobacterium sp. Sd200 TaxID=2692211 RepID=UPI00136F6E7E|nr:carboxymuconolactone decarboxylase family protein [Flavobacterium sp. Sd200]
MDRKSILKMLLLFLVLFSITMNAQTKIEDNNALDARQQNMAAISALTAIGNTVDLKTVFNSGLDSGLTINEIKEALIQLYAYCGFPRSLNALGIFKTVIEERSAKGIKDIQGKSIVVENPAKDKYEQGRKVLEELTKTPQPKPAPGFGEFAPRIDAFLKEHLFADIFINDVLSYSQRELVTISALAAMPGVGAQLKSHIGIGKNTGITDAQLRVLCNIIEKYAGRTQANILRSSIGEPELTVTAPDMMVRISEIEILPEFIEQYNAILEEESTASVVLESGVIAIYPMFQKENPSQIRIVEIYSDKKAYETHLQTPHFKKYKETTLKMVKFLKLVDMDALDNAIMPQVFKKIK